MRKRINLNAVVVYQRTQRIQPNRSVVPYSRSVLVQIAKATHALDQVVKELDKPRQLTYKDGLDRADSANADIAVIGNTLYIAGPRMQIAGHTYGDITKIPTLWTVVPVINHNKSFMVGTEALPYVGDLAKKADIVIPYMSMALTVIHLIAPESGEA